MAQLLEPLSKIKIKIFLNIFGKLLYNLIKQQMKIKINMKIY